MKNILLILLYGTCFVFMGYLITIEVTANPVKIVSPKVTEIKDSFSDSFDKVIKGNPKTSSFRWR